MFEALFETANYCPHCNEPITLLIDITQSDYIEDCSVCCRPIRILVYMDDTDDAGSRIELHCES